MSVITPTQLVEEFKKSGEFDRIRRELRKEFEKSEGAAAFLARIEDLAKQKLASDPKLQYMEEAQANKEVMQELERYPLVERAVQDVSLSDPAFVARMRDTMRLILLQSRSAAGRGTSNATTNGTSQAGGQGVSVQHQDDSDSDSSDESMDIEDDDSD